MDVNLLKKEKNELHVEFGDPTFAEILRVYLNKDGDVTFAAWKKDIGTNKSILVLKTKSKEAKAVFDYAVKGILADLEKIESDFKSLK